MRKKQPNVRALNRGVGILAVLCTGLHGTAGWARVGFRVALQGVARAAGAALVEGRWRSRQSRLRDGQTGACRV